MDFLFWTTRTKRIRGKGVVLLICISIFFFKMQTNQQKQLVSRSCCQQLPSILRIKFCWFLVPSSDGPLVECFCIILSVRVGSDSGGNFIVTNRITFRFDLSMSVCDSTSSDQSIDCKYQPVLMMDQPYSIWWEWCQIYI